MIRELALIEDFRSMNLEVSMSSNCISCNIFVIINEFLEKMKEKQLEDSKLKNIMSLLNTDKAKDFSLRVDGILRFKNRICIPEDNELKQSVLSEDHKRKISLHPEMTNLRSLIGGMA